jgi:hypothetical protein
MTLFWQSQNTTPGLKHLSLHPNRLPTQVEGSLLKLSSVTSIAALTMIQSSTRRCRRCGTAARHRLQPKPPAADTAGACTRGTQAPAGNGSRRACVCVVWSCLSQVQKTVLNRMLCVPEVSSRCENGVKTMTVMPRPLSRSQQLVQLAPVHTALRHLQPTL